MRIIVYQCMAQFQNKKTWKHLLYSKPTIVLLGILTLFFAYNVTGIIAKSRETDKNLSIALRELDSLQTQQANLQSSIDTLSSPKGIEDTIREKYRVVKDGEGLVVIVDDKKSENPDDSSNTENSAHEHGFWNFVKNIFKKSTESSSE
jgi:cell division protein FtsB